jgi:hypothetical protein
MAILEWKVFLKGKLERFLIFYISLFSIVLWFLLTEGGGATVFAETESEPDSASWGMFIVFFCLFGIPTLAATLPKLFKSKIPEKIVIDEETEKLRIHFSKRNIKELPFDGLTYALTERWGHNSLTFYKTFIGTRGQLVNNKMTELIGLTFSLSWKKSQIREISKELQKQGIRITLAENRDLPLWERIISN